MITPNSTAPFAPPAARAAVFGVAIVKSDRLCAESIRVTVTHALPQARTVVYHAAVDALAALRRAPAQLVVVGLTLRDMDGRDLVELLLREQLAHRLLVFSGRRDERARELLREGGIAGYIDTTREDPAIFEEVLRQVAAGRSYFSPCGEAEVSAPGAPLLRQILSPTELQVLAIVGEGLDDAGAADRLDMSEHTVRTHRQHIMRKLGVRTSRELIFTAIRRGVIRVLPDRILHPGLEQLLAERTARAAQRRGPNAGRAPSGPAV